MILIRWYLHNTIEHYFFHLTNFRFLGQKSKNNFVLVQMRTRKFAFEIY